MSNPQNMNPYPNNGPVPNPGQNPGNGPQPPKTYPGSMPTQVLPQNQPGPGGMPNPQGNPQPGMNPNPNPHHDSVPQIGPNGEPILLHTDGGSKDTFIIRYVINAAWILIGLILLFAVSFPSLYHNLDMLMNPFGVYGISPLSFVMGMIGSFIGIFFNIVMIAGGVYCLYRNVLKNRERLSITPNMIYGTNLQGLNFQVPVEDITRVQIIPNKLFSSLHLPWAEGLSLETIRGEIRMVNLVSAQQAAGILLNRLYELGRPVGYSQPAPDPSMPISNMGYGQPGPQTPYMQQPGNSQNMGYGQPSAPNYHAPGVPVPPAHPDPYMNNQAMNTQPMNMNAQPGYSQPYAQPAAPAPTPFPHANASQPAPNQGEPFTQAAAPADQMPMASDFAAGRMDDEEPDTTPLEAPAPKAAGGFKFPDVAAELNKPSSVAQEDFESELTTALEPAVVPQKEELVVVERADDEDDMLTTPLDEPSSKSSDSE